MTNHKEETIKRLEAAIKEAQFQIDELNKPKTHYPQLVEGHFINCFGNVRIVKDDYNRKYSAKANMFETREKAERSNLYKLLNSEYDYWFPGFSERPDFEPNGLEYFCRLEKEWLKMINKVEYWKKNVYRWKRSEN